MQVSNTTEDTPSEYMSTVCQSLAKLLGHSAQLLEFDQIRTYCQVNSSRCVGIRPT